MRLSTSRELSIGPLKNFSRAYHSYQFQSGNLFWHVNVKGDYSNYASKNKYRYLPNISSSPVSFMGREELRTILQVCILIPFALLTCIGTYLSFMV